MVGVLEVAALVHAVVLGTPQANAVPEGEAGFGTDEAQAAPAAAPSSPPAASAPAPAKAPAASPEIIDPGSGAATSSSRAQAPSTGSVTPLEPSTPRKKDGPNRVVSLTFSPLHLLLPVVEIEAELKMAPHFGVGVIGGIGSINSQTVDPGYADQSFSVYELGGQLVGYPLRDFSSLQLGAEVMWLHVSTNTYQGHAVEANAGGVAIGPLIGYKVLADVGFTCVVQGGFQYMAVRAHASDSEGNSARAETSDFVPLLNLNLGWSF